ncbi:MAG: alanine racemase [Polyangiaceae bacterium]
MASVFDSAKDADSEELGTRVAKPRRAAPADAVRPTRAEINLDNLRHNLRVVERALAPDAKEGAAAAQIWAVLKADAYGHGAPATARTLERAGAAGICVALLEEAIELREAGIRVPILVMGGYYGPQHRGLEELDEHALTPVVYHPEQIDKLVRIARARDRKEPIPIHVKVDPGMSRLGVRASEASEVLELCAATPEVRVDGLMSHLACADAPDLEPTRVQLRLFERVRRRAAELRLSPRFHHIANSAAAFRLDASRLDAVRPGIALYGVPSHAASEGDPVERLRPVMRVRSEIVALRTLEDGDAVGYGHTYVARGRRTIATIPMGYADGLSRALSNRGHVLVRGRRAPIAGVVSMDLTSIDVTDIPMVRVGDEAVVLGRQEGPLGADTITAVEIASHVGTIPWEVLTHISRRVPRFYREP